MLFSDLSESDPIYLYAGRLAPYSRDCGMPFVGLSLHQGDDRHIKHDMKCPVPLSDESVAGFQSEDVFEHIEYAALPVVFDEIFRLLKPGGLFRLSLPDYRCDVLRQRCLFDSCGEIVFDPQGGGYYDRDGVQGGGHVWFPRFESVLALFESSLFTSFEFLHYYDEHGRGVTKAIDYAKGKVLRTPDFDKRVMNPYRPMSIVVDAVKN